ARAQLVEDWWQSHSNGDQALMIAHRRSDVADLNSRARERMRRDGQLGPDMLVVGGRGFATGDHVIATRNDRRLGVINGSAGIVSAITDERLTLAEHDGREQALPVRYVRDGHLEHGYAVTAHRAQGATVDRAFVLGSDELYREWGYTALSRHREEARYYVNDGDDLQPRLPNLDVPGQERDDVPLDPLRRERAKQLALDIAH